MTTTVEPPQSPPCQPRGAQVRRLLTWSGATVLGAGVATTLLSEGPFSRIERLRAELVVEQSGDYDG